MRINTMRDERGVALFLALLLLGIVASLAIGAIMLSGNASLIGRYHAKEAEMLASADAGLEWARDTINGTPGMLPAGRRGHAAAGAAVRNATGGSHTGVHPVGLCRQQRNNHGPVRGLCQRDLANRRQRRAGGGGAPRGAVPGVVRPVRPVRRHHDVECGIRQRDSGVRPNPHQRRTLCRQQSADTLPSSTDSRPRQAPSIQRPTALSNRATRPRGPDKSARRRPAWPRSSSYATTANLSLAGGALGLTVFDPSTRIEFVPVDVNGDGDFTDENEGFIRVYRAHGRQSP